MEENTSKKISFSAIQPSGTPTIGNYFGAIRNILDMQEKGHEVFIFIADFHALTTVRDPEALRQGEVQPVPGLALRREIHVPDLLHQTLLEPQSVFMLSI